MVVAPKAGAPAPISIRPSSGVPAPTTAAGKRPATRAEIQVAPESLDVHTSPQLASAAAPGQLVTLRPGVGGSVGSVAPVGVGQAQTPATAQLLFPPLSPR